MFEKFLNQFKKAYKKLEEILNQEKNEINRDSAIKRYEICFDLAWKTLKAYLSEYLKIECHSPRSCFRSAYQEGLINYDDFWIKMIEMRNQAAHIYSETIADKVYENLPQALEYFKKLLEIFENKGQN